MNPNRIVATIACALITASGSGVAFAGNANLVQNGGFESGSGLGQIDSVVTGTGWSNTGSNNFNFILDTTADDALNGFGGGFPSVNSPGASTNIFVWGPGNGINNGFTGSADGGKFLGGDGGYATGTVTQTITGLTAGEQYTLSFEWAGAQFTDQSGAYWAGWDVDFGGESFSVGGQATAVASQGFLGWASASHNFTASSSTQVLSFLATGPSGLPPFSLLDGVSLTTVTQVPEPASLALMLAGGCLLVATAKSRRRQRGA